MNPLSYILLFALMYAGVFALVYLAERYMIWSLSEDDNDDLMKDLDGNQGLIE